MLSGMLSDIYILVNIGRDTGNPSVPVILTIEAITVRLPFQIGKPDVIFCQDISAINSDNVILIQIYAGCIALTENIITEGLCDLALEICGQVESVLHSLNNCILFLITPNNRAFRETGLLYRSDGTLGVFNSVFHAVDINKMVHCRNRNTIVLSALNVFQKLVINTVSVTVHPPASTGNDKIDFTRSLYLRPINVMLLATKVNSLHDNVPPSLLVHQSVPKLFSDRFLLC